MGEFAMAVLIAASIAAGIWSACRDEHYRKQREAGQTCPTCGGTGKFRSGQWGGFTDTCGRCGGRGVL